MVTNKAPQGEKVFGAIADPTRRAILDQLRNGELGAGELAERFPVSRPAISRHVRILARAGLLRQRREAQRRFYSLRPEALAEVDRWLAPYRLFWAARLTDVKLAAEQLHAAQPADPPPDEDAQNEPQNNAGEDPEDRHETP